MDEFPGARVTREPEEDGHKAATNCRDLNEHWEGSAPRDGSQPVSDVLYRFMQNHTFPGVPECLLSSNLCPQTWRCPGPT